MEQIYFIHEGDVLANRSGFSDAPKPFPPWSYLKNNKDEETKDNAKHIKRNRYGT